MAVFFHFQDVKDTLSQKRKHKRWIASVIESNNRELGNINYIFCGDNYLLSINQQHLKHNTLTDILTFDLSDDNNVVSADIFISLDRVQENSIKLGIPFENELRRVMIHGILHILGQKDKTEKDKSRMRSAEDVALAKF